jgi:hypothetical protein
VSHKDNVLAARFDDGGDSGNVGSKVAKAIRIGPGTRQVNNFRPMAGRPQGCNGLFPHPALTERAMNEQD